MIWLAGLCLLAQEGLVYEKRETREETRRASLEATAKKLPPVTLGPWWQIPGDPSSEGGYGRARPKVDPAVEVDLGKGKKGRWQEAKVEDGKELNVPTAMTWGRVLEAPEDMTVTVTLGSEKRWGVWLGGAHVWTPTHNSTYLLPRKVYDFSLPLKEGKNHLVIEIYGAGKFFFSLSPVGPDLLAALERRLDADFPELSEDSYYRIETIPIPKEIVLEVGGMDFAKDGTLYTCTRRGEVWSLKEGRWTRFASGLHEPLGLLAGDPGEVFAVQRTELTRLVDENADGAADRYETLGTGWQAGDGGAYAFGLVRDREGHFYGASAATGASKPGSWQGWCFRISPKGDFAPWASGFRTPNGLGWNLEGDLFITDNQGDWVGTSPLYHVVKGGFYGHPASVKGDPELGKLSTAELDRRRKRAAVLLPHGLVGQSPAQPLCDPTDGKFGPFGGQIFIPDQTSSIVSRVALEKVAGEYQGAVFPFRRGFQSGNNRMAFAPDGSLWVGQTDRGWGAVGGRPFGLERLSWTGRVPFEIRAMRATPDGFELEFTRPVDPAAASSPSAWSLQHYRYLYHETYGSPQVDVTPAKVDSVRVSPDGRSARLAVPDLVPGRIYELHASGVRSSDGLPLLHSEGYYTLNRIPAR
jgi:sugar lactone lactonase YvrE